MKLKRHRWHAKRAQRSICFICGQSLDHGGKLTDDHVFPRSRGFNFTNNMLVAHERCNSQKGNRLPYPCELIWLMFVSPQIPQAPFQPTFSWQRALWLLAEFRGYNHR